ncbi:hypothetical protein Tco_0668632 [Tanacetum coccineum]
MSPDSSIDNSPVLSQCGRRSLTSLAQRIMANFCARVPWIPCACFHGSALLRDQSKVIVDCFCAPYSSADSMLLVLQLFVHDKRSSTIEFPNKIHPVESLVELDYFETVATVAAPPPEKVAEVGLFSYK